MRKSMTLVFMIIFMMISGTTLANGDQDYKLVINLESGDTGESLQVEDIDWPDCTEEIIDSVNQGFGELYVEITNDDTIWELVKWLRVQKGTGLIDNHEMNLTLDAALNVLRMQNVVRVMRDKGLERLALRHIPDRNNTVTIQIYFVAYPMSLNNDRDTVYSSSTDTVYVVSEVGREDSKWSIGIGVERTPVSDGTPITVPTMSLNLLKKHYKDTLLVSSYKLGLTGGYWPGELDQKFFAGSFTYFPKGGSVGWISRLFYASESIETLTAYVQQGYGLTTGIELSSDNASIYMTGGMQYFDRRGQDRRLEPTINLGLNLSIKSF